LEGAAACPPAVTCAAGHMSATAPTAAGGGCAEVGSGCAATVAGGGPGIHSSERGIRAVAELALVAGAPLLTEGLIFTRDECPISPAAPSPALQNVRAHTAAPTAFLAALDMAAATPPAACDAAATTLGAPSICALSAPVAATASDVQIASSACTSSCTSAAADLLVKALSPRSAPAAARPAAPPLPLTGDAHRCSPLRQWRATATGPTAASAWTPSWRRQRPQGVPLPAQRLSTAARARCRRLLGRGRRPHTAGAASRGR